MTWYVNLDSTVAVEDDEADTEEEAIEIARSKLMEWLERDKRDVRVGPMHFAFTLDWNVEHE